MPKDTCRSANPFTRSYSYHQPRQHRSSGTRLGYGPESRMRQSGNRQPTPRSVRSVTASAGSKALRVLVIGVGWPMETFIEHLVTGLAASGVDLTVATVGSPAKPPEEWLDCQEIRWSNDGAQWSARGIARSVVTRQGPGRTVLPSAGGLLRNGARRRRELVEGPFDVVYAPWLNTLVDHPDILETRTPLVTSCRGTLVTIAPLDPSRVGHSQALARAFEHAARVHCVSDAIVGDAVGLGLDPRKVAVIRPAVDPAVFVPGDRPRPPEPTVRVLSVGGLTWTKDYESAIVAVHRAFRHGPELLLDIVGEGPDRQHLQFVIDDLGLGAKVRLLGRLSPSEIAHRLRTADVFLHTSSSEGISNAVLEAMASAVPVITTDAGGMTEAVRDGVDGLVVPVRDPGATSRALVRLAADEKLRSRLGAAGRARVLAEFRLDQQVAAFGALLHEAAGR